MYLFEFYSVFRPTHFRNGQYKAYKIYFSLVKFLVTTQFIETLYWNKYVPYTRIHIQECHFVGLTDHFSFFIHRMQIMADHSVGARDESNESEASQALMFCFDNAFPEKSCFVVDFVLFFRPPYAFLCS